MATANKDLPRLIHTYVEAILKRKRLIDEKRDVLFHLSRLVGESSKILFDTQSNGGTAHAQSELGNAIRNITAARSKVILKLESLTEEVIADDPSLRKLWSDDLALMLAKADAIRKNALFSPLTRHRDDCDNAASSNFGQDQNRSEDEERSRTSSQHQHPPTDASTSRVSQQPGILANKSPTSRSASKAHDNQRPVSPCFRHDARKNSNLKISARNAKPRQKSKNTAEVASSDLDRDEVRNLVEEMKSEVELNPDPDAEEVREAIADIMAEKPSSDPDAVEVKRSMEEMKHGVELYPKDRQSSSFSNSGGTNVGKGQYTPPSAPYSITGSPSPQVDRNLWWTEGFLDQTEFALARKRILAIQNTVIDEEDRDSEPAATPKENRNTVLRKMACKHKQGSIKNPVPTANIEDEVEITQQRLPVIKTASDATTGEPELLKNCGIENVATRLLQPKGN